MIRRRQTEYQDNFRDESESGSISIEASPSSIKTRLSGINTQVVLVAIIVLISFGASAAAWFDARKISEVSRQEASKRAAEDREAFLEQHRNTQAMIGALIRLVEESKTRAAADVEDLSWILLQTPERRAELAKRLDMPVSLKRKLGRE